MAQESIGVISSHNNSDKLTLLVMYVPSSGGIFVGRSLVSYQSHTKQNS